MRKIISFWIVAFCLLSFSFAYADECMEGDCENGIGVGFTEEGKVYSGEWQDGLPDGQGKLTVSKGTYLEGRWEKGQFLGSASK